MNLEIAKWLHLSSPHFLIALNQRLIVGDIGVVIHKQSIAFPNRIDSWDSTDPIVYRIRTAIQKRIPLPQDNHHQNERMDEGVEQQVQIDFAVVQTDTVAHPLAVMIHHKYTLVASTTVRRPLRLVPLANHTISALHNPPFLIPKRLLGCFVGVRLPAPVEPDHQPTHEEHVPREQVLLVGSQHQPIDYKQHQQSVK